MMTPMSEDGGPLREWAPLSSLLQQIPVKVQSGIFTQDIIFTCIDVVPEFIAIGTNCGLVYWYDRATGDLQRLRCENAYSSITCLRLISTVDYMVAAGNNHGVVTVFQIPKSLPESLPDSLKPKRKKQIERYNIGGLHKSPVTSVEWSKNGMKLFSGDQDGLVVLTEIDFYMHLSKSSELLNEKYAVVQLSYQRGLLLVSTLFRTILVDRNQNNKVSQVGQKERKSLGKLGAVFATRQLPTHDPVIYACRPGLRLWQADKYGTVMKTLIFKEAVQTSNTQVMLLNPAPESLKKKRGEPTFGVLLPFCDNLFVTYSEDFIHVIDPITIAITSVVCDLRKITDVACTHDEIFVLEGERNIIRIAYHPEPCNVETTEETKESLSSFVEISKPVTASLLGLTSKLKENTIVPSIPFSRITPSNIIQAISALPSRGGVDPNPVVKAEEATEMPPILPLSINIPLVTEITIEKEENKGVEYDKVVNNVQDDLKIDRRHIFQKISEQDFEDVVFTPEKKNKKIINKSNNSESNNINNQNIHETHSSFLTLSIDEGSILKPERNLEAIQRDVEDKEKLLADVLNFDLSEYMSRSEIYSFASSTNNSLSTITYVNCREPTIKPPPPPPPSVTATVSSLNINENDVSENTDESDEDESYRSELKKLENHGECSKSLFQINNHLHEQISTGRNHNKKSCQNNGLDSREFEFNVLSREFVSSAIYEDVEDWVIVSSVD